MTNPQVLDPHPSRFIPHETLPEFIQSFLLEILPSHLSKLREKTPYEFVKTFQMENLLLSLSDS